MYLRRIKFIWGSSDVIAARWRLGLFGLYAHRPGFPGTGLAISLRGVMRWMIGLALGGYLAGAAALTAWFHRQPHSQIGFVDVLTWPARRAHMRELRGRMWLAQGRDAMAARHYGEGAFLLQRGLSVWPGDYAARKELADFCLLAGRRTRALALLAEGAKVGLPDRTWRQQAIAIGKAGEDWEFVIQFCDRCLPRLGDPTRWADRNELLAAKAAALIGLKRAGEALALTKGAGDEAGLEMKVQWGAALLALGRADEAAGLLKTWVAGATPPDRPALLQLLAEAERQAGRPEAMEAALADLTAFSPSDPALAAFAIEERAKADHGAAAALEDFIFRFGGAAANLQLVAQKLAAIPSVPLVQRVVAAAQERGFALQSLQVMLAMALLRAGEWSELARTVAMLKPGMTSAEAEPRLWFEWMQRLAAALNPPAAGGGDPLLEFLGAHVLSLEAEHLTAQALQQAGRDENARAAIEIAQRFYPNSPVLAAQQAEVAQRLAARAAAAPAPPPAPRPVTIDREDFFAQLDAAIAAAHWADARREVETVRTLRPAPAWLAAHDTELLRRELRVDQALGDRPALRLAARLLLNNGAAGAGAVLAFAAELEASRARDDAVFLANTVLEKLPENRAAKELLDRLEPKDQAEASGR